MSAKAIREATGKDLLNRLLSSNSGAAKCRFASVEETTVWADLISNNPWMETSVSSKIIIFEFFVNVFSLFIYFLVVMKPLNVVAILYMWLLWTFINVMVVFTF